MDLFFNLSLPKLVKQHVYRPTRHPGWPGVPSFQRCSTKHNLDPSSARVYPAINQDTPRFPRLLVPRETAQSRDKPKSLRGILGRSLGTQAWAPARPGSMAT
jgi:hypothetical protein